MSNDYNTELKRKKYLKSVLTNDKKFLNYLISNIIKKDLDVQSIIPTNNLDDAVKLDILTLDKNGYLINIQINHEDDTEELHFKNLMFLIYLYNKFYHTYIDDIRVQKVYQIDLNLKCDKNNIIFNQFGFHSNYDNKVIYPDFCIYTCELENILNSNYKDDAFLSFLASFLLDKKEVKQLAKKYPYVNELIQKKSKKKGEF